MINNIEDVRKLFEIKKSNATENDSRKINNLEVLLSNDNVFFLMKIDTALNILRYLGV